MKHKWGLHKQFDSIKGAALVLKDPMLRSPVLFLVFNRPDLTARVFEAIRQARPSRLYIAADGPRTDRPNEAEQCRKVRTLVAQVDWPCQVETLFHDENLGCKEAVSLAITWFFKSEPEGLVLEDDCLPSPDFFVFCDELLERYRHDERVGMICGTSLFDLRKEGVVQKQEDYIFSRYFSVWGWASWARVWKDYDVNISAWTDHRRDISHLTSHSRLRKINECLFDSVQSGKIDTWDYQLSFLHWATQRVAIVPTFNLVENIGFGPDATHTKNSLDLLSKRSRGHSDRLEFPLVEPQLMVPNLGYQRLVEEMAAPPLVKKIYRRILSYVWR